MKGDAHAGALPGPFPAMRFRLHFEAEAPYVVRGYRGSAWRGVFGRALKNLVCISEDGECGRCHARESCAYPYLFETEPRPEACAPSSVDRAPHPYVICAEPCWAPREVCGETVEITLFGFGVEHWADVVRALRRAAEQGMGAERVRLRLAAAEQGSAGRQAWQAAMSGSGVLVAAPARTPEAPPMPERVRVRLATPLRVRRDNDLLAPERLGFDEFAAAVLRRLALLSRFHTERAWRLDHAGLTALARGAAVAERALGWQEWARYSTRQQRRIPMGGVMGWLVVETRGLEPLWPLLWLGQWTHAGRGAVMGLGRYELEGV
jgi:hypothetical protein